VQQHQRAPFAELLPVQIGIPDAEQLPACFHVIQRDTP
jgi:hypothetical protein